MKIALFNGMSVDNKIEDVLLDILKNVEVSHLKLRDMKIGYCRCCGGCAKIGKCVQKDDGIKAVQSYMDNEVVIFLTSIKFGGYSKELKKLIDRLLPIGSDKLQVKEGYMIHKIVHNGKLGIVIGVLDKKDKDAEEAFNSLVDANYINMDWKSYNKAVIYNSQSQREIEDYIKDTLKEVIGNV